MHNLAVSYADAGRHEDALVLHEKTLELRRRILPENHPDIGDVVMGVPHCRIAFDVTRSAAGESMDGLADLYFKLGRHQDALQLHEKVLRMRRRVLPPNHPSRGVAAASSF